MKRETALLWGSVALLVVGSVYITVISSRDHQQATKERRELRQQVSQLVRTNQDRAGIYSEFSIQVPLPDLSSDQYKQVIAGHSGE